MSIDFEVSDTLEPLKHTATALQLFRYSAVTWNPHRIHFDEPYAHEEGHRGLALLKLTMSTNQLLVFIVFRAWFERASLGDLIFLGDVLRSLGIALRLCGGNRL